MCIEKCGSIELFPREQGLNSSSASTSYVWAANGRKLLLAAASMATIASGLTVGLASSASAAPGGHDTHTDPEPSTSSDNNSNSYSNSYSNNYSNSEKSGADERAADAAAAARQSETEVTFEVVSVTPVASRPAPTVSDAPVGEQNWAVNPTGEIVEIAASFNGDADDTDAAGIFFWSDDTDNDVDVSDDEDTSVTDAGSGIYDLPQSEQEWWDVVNEDKLSTESVDTAQPERFAPTPPFDWQQLANREAGDLSVGSGEFETDLGAPVPRRQEVDLRDLSQVEVELDTSDLPSNDDARTVTWTEQFPNGLSDEFAGSYDVNEEAARATDPEHGIGNAGVSSAGLFTGGIASTNVPAAQPEQNIDGKCVDHDGDGWGWTGTQSCRIHPAQVTTSDKCVDHDGDGWGWTGTQSCRVHHYQ